MIDHVTIRVSDYEASRAFYTTVLAPLGIEPHDDDTVLFTEWGDFSIAADYKPVTQNLHIAFPAKSREKVDAFYRVAIEAGYRDNGPPGERPEYHEGYYGAFVLDPDGNNVEAVFHDREERAEVLGRLLRLREFAAELAGAYDDPVAKRGAEEMRESLDRVIELLGRE